MHSPSFAVFATVFALFSGSFASPINQLEARSQHAPATCHPNFEGVGVSITNSAVEWGTAPASVPGAYINNFSHRGPMLMHPDFRPEQDGQDPSQYIIKDVSHNHLVASVWDNKLLLQIQHSWDHNSHQLWNIVCDECAENISQRRGLVVSGCNITSVTNDWCVTTDRVKENALFLSPCNGSDDQNFDFWTATD